MSTGADGRNGVIHSPLDLILVDSDIRLDNVAMSPAESGDGIRPMVYDDCVDQLAEKEGDEFDYSMPIPNPFRQRETDDTEAETFAEEPEVVPRTAKNAPSYHHNNSMTPELFRSLIRYFTWSDAPLLPSTVRSLLRATYDLLNREPTLLRITVPQSEHLVIVGDVHGQYYDLLHALRTGGADIDGTGAVLPPGLHFLFLGDYVDRGIMGTEIMLTLCALKLLHPAQVHMIRGNHECQAIYSSYGFADECRLRYNAILAECFADVFRVLPLAALVNETLFAVHAGPPLQRRAEPVQLTQIERFPRAVGSPGGIAVELLWNDPDETLDGYKRLNDIIAEHPECSRPGTEPKPTFFNRIWRLLRPQSVPKRATPPETREGDEYTSESDDSGALPSSVLGDTSGDDECCTAPGDSSDECCLDEKAELEFEQPQELDYGIMDGEGLCMDLDVESVDDSDTDDAPSLEMSEDWEHMSLDSLLECLDRRGISAYDYVRVKALGPPAQDVARVVPSQRGAGVAFSYGALREWMLLNGVTHVFRGHQAQQRGWARHWPQHADRDGLEFWTVFSAANYGHSGNMGAIAVLHWDEAGAHVEPRNWRTLLDLPRVQLPARPRLPVDGLYN